jgi:hypothetical protein
VNLIMTVTMKQHQVRVAVVEPVSIPVMHFNDVSRCET